MSKKILISLLTIIGLSILIVSCETLQSSAREITRSYIEENKPDIKVKSASISEVTLKDITLNVALEVKNNLSFEVPVDKLQVDLVNTSGKVFASGNTVGTLKIPSKQSKDVSLKFKANYADVFTTAFDALKNKSFKCKANMNITFTVYGMSFKFPYTKELNFTEK